MLRFGFSLLLSALSTSCVGERARPAEPPPVVETTASPRVAAPPPAEPAPLAEPAPSPAPEVAPATEVAVAYTTPLVSELELARLATAACERARSARRFVLVELSAPWCADCLVLERLKKSPPLADELAHWELFAINVGDGFEHPELMRAFRVTAIAKLVTLAPDDCARALHLWPARGARTLNGVSRDRALAQTLSTWLANERRRLERASPRP